MLKAYSGFVSGLVIALLGFAQADIGFAQDISALAGQWKPTSGVLHGQNVPQSSLQSMSLTINGTSFTATSGSLNSTGTIVPVAGKLDEANFMISGGSDQNRNLFVKWQVSGNRLTLAFSEQSAPAEFNSTAANKALVMVYEKGGAGVAAGGAPTGGTTSLGNSGSGGAAGIE